MFKTEQNLVRHFVRHLRRPTSPWGMLRTSREFEYQRGRVDVLAAAEHGRHLLAFEAKLFKWREALQQAYRNSSFACSSFVVLPARIAIRVQCHADDFYCRNVGLCYISGGKITIVFEPRRQAALEPWLRNAALAALKRQAYGKRRSGDDRPQHMQKARHALPSARRRRSL